MPWHRPTGVTLSFARTSQIVVIRRNKVELEILLPEITFERHAAATHARNTPV